MDFIEEMKLEWRERYKQELTPREAAHQFALHNIDARVNHLKQLKAPEAMSPREASDRLVMERALRNAHDQLRNIGR
jgi:hypothetical protein